MLTRRQFLKTSALQISSLFAMTTSLDFAFQNGHPPIEGLGSSGGERQNSTKKSILVIGAGMAGLAAGKTLAAQGYTVTVLEARDRIGGRTWTDDSLGLPLDLGGAWIHGESGNPLTELAKKLNLTTALTDYDSLALYFPDGQRIGNAVLKETRKAYDNLKAAMLALNETVDSEFSLQQGYDQVVEQVLREQNGASNGTDPVSTQLLRWQTHSEIELEYAYDLKGLALQSWEEDEQFPGDDLLIIGGYKQIAQSLADGLTIQLNQSVKSVTITNDSVEVATLNGSYAADRVLVTVPLGVLKSNSITFAPPLPEAKQSAINRLEMGLLNKIILKFDQAFWEPEVYVLARLNPLNQSDNHSTQGIEFFSLLPSHNEPILVGLVSGSQAKELELKSDSEITALAMADLRSMYGSELPDPSGVKITRWSQDPLAGGSYARIPPGASINDYNILAEAVSDRLFFAGEATHRSYPNTVHGAYLSGLREAEKIAQL